MSRQYVMRYQLDLSLLQRAMTSWARPQKTLLQKLGRFALLLLAGAALGALVNLTGLSDHLTIPMLTGALVGFYIGLVFWFVMHRRDVKRLSGFTMAQMQKQGPVEVTLSEERVVMNTAYTQFISSWETYDQVIKMRDATALRAGALIYTIPYSALPEGVEAEAFHADIVAWKEAAQ